MKRPDTVLVNRTQYTVLLDYYYFFVKVSRVSNKNTGTSICTSDSTIMTTIKLVEYESNYLLSSNKLTRVKLKPSEDVTMLTFQALALCHLLG